MTKAKKPSRGAPRCCKVPFPSFYKTVPTPEFDCWPWSWGGGPHPWFIPSPLVLLDKSPHLYIVDVPVVIRLSAFPPFP